MLPLTKEALPARYNERTKLQLEVKPGTNEKDFELTSDKLTGRPRAFRSEPRCCDSPVRSASRSTSSPTAAPGRSWPARTASRRCACLHLGSKGELPPPPPPLG